MFQRMCSTCVCHLNQYLLRPMHCYFPFFLLSCSSSFVSNELTLLNNRWNLLIGMLDEAQPTNEYPSSHYKVLRWSCKVKGKTIVYCMNHEEPDKKKGAKEIL